MASPISEAFVRISPDFTGFREKILAGLKKEIDSLPVQKVPVALTITPASAEALRRQIAEITGVVVKVTPVASGTPAVSTAAATAGAAATSTVAAATAETSDEQRRKAALDLRRAQVRTTVALEAEEARAAAQASKQIDAAYKQRISDAAEESAAVNISAKEDIKSFRDSEKAFQLQAAAERAITQEIKDARAQLAQVPQAGVLKATPVGTAQAELTASSRALIVAKKIEKDAIEAENPVLLANARLLVADAEASKLASTNALIAAREQRDLAKATAEANSQVATGLRGVGATGLSFLGLRGATLAASSAFLAGAASAAIFAKSLGAFASFEQTLNTFQAVTGATADQMERVSAAAKQLGNDITLPAVSAADAATAMTELAKAGLSVTQSIAAARGVLQLATAAGIDNAQAVELVATALNSFELAGRDAVRVADDFANAANAAQGSIGDFGQALEQSAAVAHQAGLNLNDTISLLALFAKNGLRGSDAGTSLRTALVKLIAPTEKASEVIQTLGLHIRDAQGNIRPDIFAQFGVATQHLTPELRDTFAEIIAGTDAIRAFSIGAREGASGLKDIQDQIAKQGTAADVAAARTKGLSGSAEAFKNTASTLAITIGHGLAPAVEELATAGTNAVTSLGHVATAVGTITHPLAPFGRLLADVAKALGTGIGPALALFAAFKGLAAAQGLAAAAASRLISLQRGAGAATAVAGQEAATAAVEWDVLAASEDTAAVSGAAAAAGGEAAAGGLAALGGPLGLVLGGAVALGFGLQFLGRHESDTKKATDELAESARHLGVSFDAQNLVIERKALEDLAKAQLDAATAANTRRVGPGQLQTDTQQAAADAAAGFIRKLREQAAAVRDLDPVLAHNRDALADFIKLIGRVPTKKEIKIFADNKQAKTSLQEIILELEAIGGRASADAQDALNKLLLQSFVKKKFFGDIIELPTPADIAGISNSALALGKIIPTLDAGEKRKAINSFRDLINQLRALGPEGEVALKELGVRLGKSFAAGLSETDKDSIAAANQAVADAIKQGNEQVDAAVSSAKTNLGSIATTLASAIGQVLDARATAAIASLDKSSLAKEIKSLQGQLDKTNVEGQRAQLLVNIGQATDEASLQAANFALRQFDLQQHLDTDKKILQNKKDNIAKIAAAEKQAVTNSITAAANAFASGQITLAKFTDTVLNTLKGQKIDFQKTGGALGDTLGKAFFAGAQAQLNAFLDQAAALAGFTGRVPGGTTQPSTVKPAEALAASQRAVQDALHNRGRTLAQIEDDNNRLLKIISGEKPSSRNNNNSAPKADANPALGGSGRSKAGRRQAVKQ